MTIGRLLPRLIAVMLLIDVGTRFLPLDPLCFQAWECMTRYQEPGAIFQANRQFRSETTHGNLSNMGNLPAMQQIRAQLFTTDRYGFRNAPALVDAGVDALVVGDSFVAGYGNSDPDTLPVQLSRLTGATYYNAGGPYAYLATARRLTALLRPRGPRVIVVSTENVPIAFYTEAEARAARPDVTSRLFDSVFGSRGEHVRALMRGWWFTSPVKIAGEKAFLAIADDRILPNVYAGKVVMHRLSNGTAMLFYPPDIQAVEHPGDPSPLIDHLARVADGLRQQGLDPLVLLAPSKYTVYYPFLEGAVDRSGIEAPLAQVEARLRARGIAALDLTGPFRDRARRAMADGHYLYWIDDTHWNARGIEIAARLVVDWLNAQTTSKGNQ